MSERPERYRALAMQNVLGALKEAYKEIVRFQGELILKDPSSRLLRIVDLTSGSIRHSLDYEDVMEEMTGIMRKEITLVPEAIGKIYCRTGQYVDLLEKAAA